MPKGDIIVEMADMKVGKGSGRIVTYALGSCIGMAIYDPSVKVGGILHYMLPDASLNPEKAKENPYMFGNTGIPKLFKAAYQLGAKKPRIQVKIAGGANVIGSKGAFNIGKRNYMMARKMLWKNGVLIAAEDVGGTVSRTMILDLGTGDVLIKCPGREPYRL